MQIDALVIAKEKADKLRKEYNYKVIDVPCCLTCKHSGQMYDELTLECEVLEQSAWGVSDVSELGICDKYVKHPQRSSG